MRGRGAFRALAGRPANVVLGVSQVPRALLDPVVSVAPKEAPVPLAGEGPVALVAREVSRDPVDVLGLLESRALKDPLGHGGPEGTLAAGVSRARVVTVAVEAHEAGMAAVVATVLVDSVVFVGLWDGPARLAAVARGG